MDSAHWQQVQTLFHQAAALPKNIQEAFLQSKCEAAGPELVGQVLAMLEEDARNSSPLDRNLSAYADSFVGVGALPSQIGPYRIGEQLGHGGMGVVHLAYRDDLGAPVAIKFLRDAWMSPVRAQRFSAEQRALAQLNHPFIARLYDADTLPDGTPWFAMEYVDGLPLTQYCERNRCSLEKRLVLVRQVAQAVQYAHTRAVIHRDLKPSNILVKPDATPRLLDFGIAKQLGATDAPAEQTRTELRVFSAAYAAPEQVRGEAAGSYTDVYALGVILYQILTGSLPTVGSDKPSVALLPGLYIDGIDYPDLDLICAVAMHQDVERRYHSADAFIRDLDHFTKQEPLEARPDTFQYRAGKFLARNRRNVVAAALAFALLASSSAYYFVRLTAARQAVLISASRTERVQKFMLNLFDSGDKFAGPAQDLRVVTLLDGGVKQAESLSADRSMQAELYRTLGGVYQHLGKLDRADSLLRSSLEIRERSKAPDEEIADSLVALGLLRAEQAKFKEAETLVRAGLAKAGSRNDPELIATSTAALGKVVAARGQYRQAIPILEEAIRLQPGAASPELAATLRDLAGVHFFLGNYDLCDLLTRRAMDMHIRVVGARHPSVADDLIDIGNVQQQRGRYLESEKTFRTALAINEEWYGMDHPETASNLTILSQSLAFQNRLDEVAGLLDRALAIQERAYGHEHPRVAFVLNEMATNFLRRERWDDAERSYSRTLTIYRSSFGDRSQQVALALSNLGTLALNRKDYRRAEVLFRDVVARDTELLPPDHFNTGVALLKLGRVLIKQNRLVEAEPHTLASYRILSNQTDAKNIFLVSARRDLATIYTGLGQPEKASQYQAQTLSVKR